MTYPKTLNVSSGLVAQVVSLLSTRTLHQFADEARADGESLRDLVDRYEIDYAWQVLGSQRLFDATRNELAHLLQREPTEQQKADLVAVLEAVAMNQASDRLMSFDNDLAQQLAEVMVEAWGSAQSEHAPSETV